MNAFSGLEGLLMVRIPVACVAGWFAVLLAGAGAQSVDAQDRPDGYAIESATVVSRCARCHTLDDDRRMTRISYLRKTPEGWQTSIRRMMALHGVRLEATEAAEIVRYLANEQGLAPEELRPGRFEVERRMIEYDYPGDSGVEFTCIQCHSMGRVITQRRTEEEWELLLATHRALYPLVDNQSFLAGDPGDEQPMDVAVDHLSEEFPLETPEWSAWAATKRSPPLAGTWTLSGYEPGKGAIYGTVRIQADPGSPDDFTTTTSYTYAETGEHVTSTGAAIVYTGYQWRGRSNSTNQNTEAELREVMLVERDLRTMSGRWFRGAYDEIGPDVTLTRVGSEPVLAGVYPRALERGASTEVTLYGASLAGVGSSLDFGEGVTVERVGTAGGESVTLRLSVAEDAAIGPRDLLASGSVQTVLESAVIVHDGVDRIEVTPSTGMARVGGGNFPKGLQVFEAMGWDDGPDGESETEDDLALGRVEATWRIEEYSATFSDDDAQFVGSMGADGVFTPALDGPNPERRGNRNNVGDVWVVATHAETGADELSARAQLVVTVPLYMRWEPWRVTEDQLPAPGGDR
jgi:quinohemoprotein amine dehydrogenase